MAGVANLFGAGSSKGTRDLLVALQNAHGNPVVLCAHLDAFNRALGRGDVRPNLFVEEGGLDQLNILARDYPNDADVQKHVYITAMNVTYKRPEYTEAMRRRPFLSKTFSRGASYYGHVVDVDFPDGECTLPSNWTVDQIVNAMAKATGNVRTQIDGIGLLKKALDRGGVHDVLNWHGDAAVVEAINRYGSNPALRTNAFHFLVALKVLIENSDGHIKAGFTYNGRHLVNDLMRSEAVDMEEDTGLVYAPCRLHYSHTDTYVESGVQTGSGTEECTCFGSDTTSRGWGPNFFSQTSGLAAGSAHIHAVQSGSALQPTQSLAHRERGGVMDFLFGKSYGGHPWMPTGAYSGKFSAGHDWTDRDYYRWTDRDYGSAYGHARDVHDTRPAYHDYHDDYDWKQSRNQRRYQYDLNYKSWDAQAPHYSRNTYYQALGTMTPRAGRTGARTPVAGGYSSSYGNASGSPSVSFARDVRGGYDNAGYNSAYGGSGYNYGYGNQSPRRY